MTLNGTGIGKDTASGGSFSGLSPVLSAPSTIDQPPWLPVPGSSPTLVSPAPESADTPTHRECSDRVVWQLTVPIFRCVGGHSHSEQPEDRVHYSESRYVDAALMRAREAFDGRFYLGRVDVHISQHDRAAEPHISLGMEDERDTIDLTGPEARQLATALIEAADEIAGA